MAGQESQPGAVWLQSWLLIPPGHSARPPTQRFGGPRASDPTISTLRHMLLRKWYDKAYIYTYNLKDTRQYKGQQIGVPKTVCSWPLEEFRDGSHPWGLWWLGRHPGKSEIWAGPWLWVGIREGRHRVKWRGSHSRQDESPEHWPRDKKEWGVFGQTWVKQSTRNSEFTSGGVEEEEECWLIFIEHLINDAKPCTMYGLSV